MDDNRVIKTYDEDAFVLIFTKEDAEEFLNSEDSPMTDEDWFALRRSMGFYFQPFWNDDVFETLVTDYYEEKIKNG